MHKKAGSVAVVLLTLIQTLSVVAQTPPRTRNFDEPEEEDSLNRELWEFVKKTPYDDILSYLAASHRDSQSKQNTQVELPNGWRLAPAGTQVDVGRLPYEAIVFAGKLVVLDTGYYYQEPQEVTVIDLNTGRIEKFLRINSLFPSAVIGSDGDLYISGGFDQKVYRVDSRFEVVREYSVAGFAGGLAAIGPAQLAVGYMATKNAEGNYVSGKLAILNTETGKVETDTPTGYFPYEIKYLENRIYVTLLGENKLLVFNRQAQLIKSFAVGRQPLEMCSDRDKLYVVNSTSDSLSVLDLRSNSLRAGINVADPVSRFGRSPTSCAVQGNRLYVTLADINAVGIFDKRTGRRQGLMPTGWYPTKVITGNEGVLVLNAKGIRARRPNPSGPQPTGPSRNPEYVLNLLKGTVSIISESDIRTNLRTWTERVSRSSPSFMLRDRFRLPVRHLFYVIKENRTYDQVLGDLPRGNGDPSLTLFGKAITPVHHQLASDFVTLDNFFVNGEISVLGHSFTTSGYASPFLEWLGNLSYSQRWKGYPFGTVPAVTSPAYIWDALDQKRVDYRIYGENYFLFTRAYRILVDLYGAESSLAKKFYDKTVTAAGAGDRGNEFYQFARAYYGRANTRDAAYKLLGDSAFVRSLSTFLTGDASFAAMVNKDLRLRRQFADYLYHYPFNYRSWDLKYSDLERVRDWQRDFEAQLKNGNLASFHYIWLPNDHTEGSITTTLNPLQFVAQNDAALGRLVEIISHSPVWKNSLILIVEDDAQNGPDHVDATRTVALAVGPYVKRNALINDRYDQLSMLRTIEQLLGLDPMNLGDRLAAPMFTIFSDTPDYRPFVPPPPSPQLADADRQRYNDLAR